MNELESAKQALLKQTQEYSQTTKDFQQELEDTKKLLLAQEKDYAREIKDYQLQLKDKKQLEKQNLTLSKEISEISQNYELLEQRHKELQNENKLIKAEYANLPDENAVLHYNLGVFYTQNRDYKRAILEFEKVLEVNPNDTETIYNLGVIYGEYLGSREKAIAHFKRYLSLAPNDADADRARKYILTWETLDQKQ